MQQGLGKAGNGMGFREWLSLRKDKIILYSVVEICGGGGSLVWLQARKTEAEPEKTLSRLCMCVRNHHFKFEQAKQDARGTQ